MNSFTQDPGKDNSTVPMSLQKESKWEKEFEKVMGCIPECADGLYEDVGCPAHGYDAMKAIKFFRGILSQREKEIAEEVAVTFAKSPLNKRKDKDADAFYLDVLQIIKH